MWHHSSNQVFNHKYYIYNINILEIHTIIYTTNTLQIYTQNKHTHSIHKQALKTCIIKTNTTHTQHKITTHMTVLLFLQPLTDLCYTIIQPHLSTHTLHNALNIYTTHIQTYIHYKHIHSLNSYI